MTSLKSYNTFGIESSTKQLHSITNKSELIDFLSTAPDSFLFLGGGSNILLTQAEYPCVAINNIEGVAMVFEDDRSVIVKAGGGVNWHEFVMFTLNQGWYGLENLALIPGTVGAAPIQNIGAYGKEVKDFITEVHAIEKSSLKDCVFDNDACAFDYRNSFFKQHKHEYYIYEVYFKLQKSTKDLNISYGAIADVLKQDKINSPTPLDVAKAVIQIRSSKLPDPKKIGNSGSFFKNPIVDEHTVERLKAEYDSFPLYPFHQQFKLAAGWLIDQCGWKGKNIDGRYGVHDLQALVLVNLKDATGKEIFDLSETIINSVKDKFGVELEREVNIY